MTLNPLVSRLATAWSSRSIYEPLTGLFLCAEPDEAFFRSAVFKFGSNPVESARYLSPIIGVFIDVKRFKQEHPLISAEVNGFSGR